MEEQYEGGRSIQASAEAHGRSYGFVRRVLTEPGVSLRRPGRGEPAGAPRAGRPLSPVAVLRWVVRRSGAAVVPRPASPVPA
ncbi:helix-turn-helix domain-containing protein [Streptomyces eurythermus]|uniref:helix-turn-helix domain-containing protein n=1 Tax=Streptomyces eurythermus TaxID=42237 RepID=UPI003F4D5FDB